LSAFVPNKPDAPITTIQNATVIITWNAPNNQGSPITSYLITLQTATGTFLTQLTDCDGSSAIIRTNTKCTIPLSTLTASPFNLTLGASINA
jgi:hypothetical protein